MGRHSFITAYLGVVGAAFFIQLLIGSNVLLLVIIGLIAAFGAIPISRRDLMITDVIFFATTLYYSTFALVIKSLLGQPLDQNLQAPILSAAYLTIGFTSMAIGYVAANSFVSQAKWIKPFVAEFGSRHFCRKVALWVFAIGSVLAILHNVLRGQVVEGSVEEGGFGGFGSFLFLLPFGWACQARLAFGSGATRRDSGILYAMGVVALFLALLANVKVIVVQYILVLILSFTAFGIRVRLRTLLVGALGVLLLILYVQPIIQITRGEAEGKSVFDRLTAIGPILVDSDFSASNLQVRADAVARGYRYSYLGSYVYPSTWSVDRFSMILPIDEVARKLGEAGTTGGGDIVKEVVENTLPSAVVSKTGVATADTIGWHFGFTRNGSISRPVVGLVASCLAAYGILGVVLLPAVITFLTFAVINCLGTHLRGSAWSIFVLMTFIVFVEKEIAPIITLFTHEIPLEAVVVGIAYAAANMFGTKRRPMIRRSRTVAVGGRPPVI